VSTRRSFLTRLLGGALLAKAAKAEQRPVEELFLGVPAPDDPLELLYSRRLSFDHGQPLITVRVVEGRQQVTLRALGTCALFARNEKGEHLAAGNAPPGKLTLKLVEGTPGVGATWVELEQLRFDDKQAVQHAKTHWAERGVPVRIATVGEAYGIAGHVVDTRRYAILAEGDATEASARAQAEEIEKKFGIRTQLHRELAHRPRGRLELSDDSGKVLASGDSALELRSGDAGVAVDEVEFGMGYSFHGFEKRTYPGRLFATVDSQGKLAVVAALPMERLVKGVVPSEIFAKAHLEALKAQAVTARGEVLAKIGARHLGDPYLLCAEQHCQVYRGLAAEERGPDKAVDETRGEALFSGNTRLVDSVYSAVCGGYTEDNDAVWGGPADPSLRGRPDFAPNAKGMGPFVNGIGAALVGKFVKLDPVPTYCSLSGLAKADKVRWHKSFTRAEVDAICAHFNVGSVQALAVEGRGVSGRARALRIHGEKSVARVYGELPIRRLFHNLNSGMFVVEKQGEAWVFTGGGWGHGSGMCQTGAIGRAERGATYKNILGWYYSGARPVRIY
jgi:stage II sporulation protein D